MSLSEAIVLEFDTYPERGECRQSIKKEERKYNLEIMNKDNEDPMSIKTLGSQSIGDGLRERVRAAVLNKGL